MLSILNSLQKTVRKALERLGIAQSRSRLKRGLLKIRKLTEKKDDPIELFAKANAIYNSNEWKEVSVSEFLKDYKLSLIGEGLHARAYKIENENWIVKEARWDLKMDLFGDVKLPLPVRFAQKILQIFAFKFLPDKEFIQEDFNKYLQFTQYMGYFPSDRHFSGKNREILFKTQQTIRSNLLSYKSEIEKHYRFTLHEGINQILHSNLKYTNFLPREYQLIGSSISPENDHRTTSFIFQQYIAGDLLFDIPQEIMPKRLKQQLILLMYLILLMNMQVHIIPDTRPRYPVFQAYNWILKTDNIIVQNNRVYFIDTRWFWESRGSLLKRGIIISRMSINNCKEHINKLLE